MRQECFDRLVNIPFQKRYKLPSDIVAKHIDGFLLLISPSSGNWIVADNQTQADIVKALISGLSIQESMERLELSEENADLRYMLEQIEGKRFAEAPIIEEDTFILRLYITNQCDLRCKHCFMYAGEREEDELSLEEIQYIIQQSKNGGCSKIILSGGEVSMRKDLAEIVRFAKKMGLYVQLMTNGYSWQKSSVDAIAPYLDEVQISIDGFDEETNRIIRGKGVFERALQSLDWFYAHENVFTSVVVTPLYDILNQHVQEYVDFGGTLVNKYDANRFLLIVNAELIDGRTVKADKKKNEVMRKLVDQIYERIYPNAKLTTFVMNHAHNRIYRNCGYGGLTIAANGDFYFCGRIHDVKCYGNIRNENFQSILKKRKLARERSYVDWMQPCGNCELKYICGGGCRVSHLPSAVKMELEQDSPSLVRVGTCTELDKREIYRYMIDGNEFLY